MDHISFILKAEKQTCYTGWPHSIVAKLPVLNFLPVFIFSASNKKVLLRENARGVLPSERASLREGRALGGGVPKSQVKGFQALSQLGVERGGTPVPAGDSPGHVLVGGGVPGVPPTWEWVPSERTSEPETRDWGTPLEGTWYQRLGRNLGPKVGYPPKCRQTHTRENRISAVNDKFYYTTTTGITANIILDTIITNAMETCKNFIWLLGCPQLKTCFKMQLHPATTLVYPLITKTSKFYLCGK